jgi:hypothetical protein
MQLLVHQNSTMDKNKTIEFIRQENQFISYLLEAFEVPERRDGKYHM